MDASFRSGDVAAYLNRKVAGIEYNADVSIVGQPIADRPPGGGVGIKLRVVGALGGFLLTTLPGHILILAPHAVKLNERRVHHLLPGPHFGGGDTGVGAIPAF
jgi:hypothetical protein